MDYEQALKRLVNHANLSDELPAEVSLGGLLWMACRTKKPFELSALCDDVIDCLETVTLTCMAICLLKRAFGISSPPSIANSRMPYNASLTGRSRLWHAAGTTNLIRHSLRNCGWSVGNYRSHGGGPRG